MSNGAWLLRRGAKVERGDGRVLIRHLDREVELEGGAAQAFERVSGRLDGRTTLDELEGDRERIRRLLETLARTGVVVRTGGEPASMSGEEFHALHRRYASHWLQPVYEHSLWEKITSGRATRAQVLGFAFEKYHYIEAAYEHMGIAAANATPELMPHLARHFIEEHTHGDIYRAGLRSLFADDVVLGSQPLPTTRALVNLLSETAARDSFAYYAGNEVLQMTENTSDGGASASIDGFYEAMRRHYPWSERLVESFVAHTRADQKLGHESVFAEMCRSVPRLSPREVKDAMNVARSMAEHLVLFLDGIEQLYERFPSVPRLACELGCE